MFSAVSLSVSCSQTLSGQADWLTGVYVDSLVSCCREMNPFTRKQCVDQLLFRAQHPQIPVIQIIGFKRTFYLQVALVRRNLGYISEKLHWICVVSSKETEKNTLYVRVLVCLCFLECEQKGACSACSKSMSPSRECGTWDKEQKRLGGNGREWKRQRKPWANTYRLPPSNIGFEMYSQQKICVKMFC